MFGGFIQESTCVVYNGAMAPMLLFLFYQLGTKTIRKSWTRVPGPQITTQGLVRGNRCVLVPPPAMKSGPFGFLK